MRQAIGSTWVLQLVIIFMLIFVAFLALTINYTKAFRVKNEVISIIEKYEGVSTKENGSVSIINNYLDYNNFFTQGKCNEGEYGVKNLNENIIEEASPSEKYNYCITKINTSNNSPIATRSKYRVTLFFKFSLPVIGDLFTFSVEGTTIDINYAEDDL